MLIRSFIAVNIPDHIKEKTIPILKDLKSKGVHTVYPQNLHFTVKFLGEIKPDLVSKTIMLLPKIEFSPFKIQLKGVGAFPNKEYARVIWVGVESEGLEKLSMELTNSLEKLFPKDRFSAHLTLGRAKRKVDLNKFFEMYSGQRFGSFIAESFEMMQSELTKKGPIYSVLWSSKNE